MVEKFLKIYLILMIVFAAVFNGNSFAESDFNIEISKVMENKNFENVIPNDFSENINFELFQKRDGFFYISRIDGIIKDYMEYTWDEDEDCFYGENLIGKSIDISGDREKVKWIQESLTIADVYTDVDGGFGPKTKANLRKFKKNSGLPEDIIFDKATEMQMLSTRKEKSAKFFDTVDVLVNKNYFLPKEYTPEVEVANVKSFKNIYVSTKIKKSVEKMFSDAKEAGHNLVLLSGYRTYSYQRTLFKNRLNAYGFSDAEKAVALPGESEHQTGLAIDISSSDYNYNLGKGFESTNSYKWMMENCYKYGFILRYLENKTDITGYKYEPWHYRYIGDVEKAKYIMEKGITYEEYLKEEEIL